MSYINFNPTAQQGFQNALGMGMQMGAQAAEAKNRREYRNALSDVMMGGNGTPGIGDGQGGGDITGPKPESMAILAERNPQLYMKLQERQQAQEAQRIEAQLTQRALAGDPEAVKQMAAVNFDKWKTLDTGMKERAAEEAEVFGNAAMDVLNLPPQQRPQAILGYANRFGSQEIAQIADLPPQEQEAALRAAVAEAGMIKELQAMERPDYMTVGADETLVDVRNPGAVRQFARGSQGQPVSKTLSNGTTAYQNPETGEWFTTPEEAMGGSGGNAGGGF